MRKADFISAIVLATLALGLLVYAIPQQISAGLGFGLSPKSLPATMGVGILILSIAQGAGALWRGRKAEATGKADERPGISAAQWRFLGILTVILAVSLLAINYLGFITGGILFLLMFQFLAGQRKVMLMVSLAVLTPIILKLAFWYGMGILLPHGLLI